MTMRIWLNSMRTSVPDSSSGVRCSRSSVVAPAPDRPAPCRTRRSPGGRSSSGASPSRTVPAGSVTRSVRAEHSPASARLSHASNGPSAAVYARIAGAHVGGCVGDHVSPAWDGSGVGDGVAATRTSLSARRERTALACLVAHATAGWCGAAEANGAPGAACSAATKPLPLLQGSEMKATVSVPVDAWSGGGKADPLYLLSNRPSVPLPLYTFTRS